jgi:hypothetical protein
MGLGNSHAPKERKEKNNHHHRDMEFHTPHGWRNVGDRNK